MRVVLSLKFLLSNFSYIAFFLKISYVDGL